MSSLMERLDILRTRIQEPDFLAGRGLSNEVNISIFCYEPQEEMAVRHFTERLTAERGLTCRVIEYNLYKVFLSICGDKRITERIPGLEEKKGERFVRDQLLRIADSRAFINKMRDRSYRYGDVILLTGIGEVFPFIRVHTLLEAMQPHFSDVPILVMYPGTFDGRSLKLFDKLTPNSYYRAFNVI